MPITDLLETNTTVLAFNHRCAYRQKLTQWLHQSNVSPNVIEISSYHALLNCVSAGMGMGIVPKVLLDQYPFADDLHVHDLPNDIANTVTSAVWRKQVRRPSIDAFTDILGVS